MSFPKEFSDFSSDVPLQDISVLPSRGDGTYLHLASIKIIAAGSGALAMRFREGDTVITGLTAGEVLQYKPTLILASGTTVAVIRVEYQ